LSLLKGLSADPGDPPGQPLLIMHVVGQCKILRHNPQAIMK